jgi:hypothetical protein
MPFLVILKRFEVWLLVALVIALFVFAFRPEPAIDSTGDASGGEPVQVIKTSTANDPTETAPEVTAETITVEEVKVTTSKRGIIVELTLSGRAPSGKDLTLDESSVTATTGEGETVNRFFEPFREPAVLLASGDSLATLKWWLERPAAIIWLDLQGERVKAVLP